MGSSPVAVINVVFHKLLNSLPCVQYPLWLEWETKNSKNEEKKSDSEKYKHIHGHNKSILEIIYRFGHPKNVPKNFLILKHKQVCYCTQNIFICIWYISTNKTHFLEAKFHKLRSKTICCCLLKKKTWKQCNSQQKYIK